MDVLVIKNEANFCHDGILNFQSAVCPVAKRTETANTFFKLPHCPEALKCSCQIIGDISREYEIGIYSEYTNKNSNLQLLLCSKLFEYIGSRELDRVMVMEAYILIRIT